MVFHGVILGFPSKRSLLVAPTDTYGIVEVRLSSPFPVPAFDPLYSLVLVEDEVWDNEARCFVHCKVGFDKVLCEGMLSQEGEVEHRQLQAGGRCEGLAEGGRVCPGL